MEGGGHWKPHLLPSRCLPPPPKSPGSILSHAAAAARWGLQTTPGGHRPPATSPAPCRLLLGERDGRPGMREPLRRGPPPAPPSAPEAAACCVCCMAEKKRKKKMKKKKKKAIS